MKQRLVKVHPNDNVLVALTDLPKGETVSFDGEEFTLQEDIPAKHKFVTSDLNTGDPVMMYGVLVGKAQTHIAKGGIISTANLKHAAEPFFTEKQILHGKYPIYPGSAIKHSMGIIAAMAKWVQQTTGFSFPPCFAKTVTWM